MEDTIAVFIPIIFIIVTGFVIVTIVYLKSREKQLMIEKGLSADQIAQLLSEKEHSNKNRFILLKSGIVLIFLVLFGMIGNMIDRAYFYQWKTFENGTKYFSDEPVYAVWMAFLGLGIGAVVAHFASLKLEKREN
ncbi:MAG: hypothetical protein N2321_10530 [Melioribacteraceae bacterium]|nr:hypothetical protein [Melioribacteraceae bacterium]